MSRPDEGADKILALRNGREEYVIVQPPRLTHLALGPIAVNSMLEQSLGHRHHHLMPVGDIGRHNHKNHAERKGRQCSVSAREELVYELAAAQTL